MTNNDDLRQRLYAFALSVVKLVRSLPKEMASYEIGKQLLRSGTSVSANYEEATGAFSKDDFIYKISISFKEAKETNFWLRLLKDSNILMDEELNRLIRESEELRNILGKSVTTAKKNVRLKISGT